MAMRAIRDEHAVEWEVWDVRPSWSGRPRPRGETGASGAPLAPQLEGGWLTFRTAAGERRRIVPAPKGWEALDDQSLARLLAMATAVVPSHRRLIE
jgi:hypothetical protein